jgi:hypothetical protein
MGRELPREAPHPFLAAAAHKLGDSMARFAGCCPNFAEKHLSTGSNY